MIETFPKIKRYNVVYKLSKKYKVSILCIIVWVSESWYYKHKKLILNNNTKEEREKEDLLKIKSIVLKYRRRYWYRMITMKLISQWLKINHKKVLRLMRKYWLLSIIRRKDPYSNIRKAIKEHRTCDNLLNREFKWWEVFKKLWTDISYLHYNWTKAYISILKDMVSWEIISHKVSSSLWMWLVIQTINEWVKNNKYSNLKWSMIQSDQWFHYTSPQYISLLRNNWILQSMSRKWNCLDNAPTESFFGHMKDEIDLKDIKSFNQLVKYIDKYIFHYNNMRPQWNKKKMTPVDYRNHLLN